MIEFRGVTKQFPDGTVAVENVDIVMPPHKTTVLVGSSGSGKTTLLRMINRMVDPTGGQVLIDGTDVATREPVALRRSQLGQRLREFVEHFMSAVGRGVCDRPRRGE